METYTRSLNVYTTVQTAQDQGVAYRALRKGIMDFEKRQIYRGPEEFVTLPTDPNELKTPLTTLFGTPRQ